MVQRYLLFTRYLEPECGALALFRPDAESKAVAFEYLFTYGKTQSRAYHITLDLGITVIAVEHLRQHIFSYALAVVADLYPYLLIHIYLFKANDLIIISIIDGIVQEIIDDLIQLIGIGSNFPVVISLIFHIVAVLFDDQLITGHAVVELINNGEFL